MTQRLAFAWWWTGGHVMPIAALIEHAVDHSDVCPKCKWYWIWSSKSLEYDVSQRYRRVCFLPILSGKWRSYGWWREKMRNLRDVVLLVIGIVQAVYYLLWYRIDCVFCKWWYVALPTIIAARLLRRRIVVHESDAVPGKTNRLAMRWASDVLCGLPIVDGADNKTDVSRQVGQLLSPSLWHTNSSSEWWVLQPQIQWWKEKTTILVLLWSQWSQTVLSTLLTLFASEMSTMAQYERIILTGRLNSDYADRFAAYGVEMYTFVDHDVLRWLYMRADWCISRGSATALAEQKLFDIRHMIVPLPHAGWNHQYHNACYFVEKYDDVMLLQDDTLYDALFSHLSTPLAKTNKSTTLKQRQDRLLQPIHDVRSILCPADEHPW